jgi:antitoxin ParD1/3/4
MNISLTPPLEAMIRKKVETGLYNNASEVVREALHLMEERNRREQLRAAIAVGDEQFARGEFTTWTADSMRRLMQEADMEECQGLPIRDDVLP